MTAFTRNNVQNAAVEFVKELRQSRLKQLLRIEHGNVVDNANTGGSVVEVAKLEERRAQIQVWFDKYLDGKNLVFWVGFYANDQSIIKNIIKYCPARMRNGNVFRKSDMKISGKISFLKKRPDDQDLKFPIQEYYDDTNYFGIYETESFNVEKALRFIETVVSSLPEFDSGVSNDIFPENNRILVGEHLRIERKAALARECKKRDRYRCQICNFHFVERYGLLGENFAEAHHKVPLSKLDGEVKNCVDDLVTVCANCHRMLHRLEGKPTDIVKLRRIFKHVGKCTT
ncbi:HNH endonuclease [Beijerinckia indica]|uniref:HNH endonuclease n=1 Tax=Beijerinckia indica subsp. indica (strain ATCC 9039 / DSM 1715 / NCIMB 8712) TaxID=395963 RepID=B2IKM5_BEII9|nr:HNH endonuclease [Beijerinckia indica]ACB95064.1 HNH endonuclease [Beijerinckia indica subsp. indica ATCC 9039]